MKGHRFQQPTCIKNDDKPMDSLALMDTLLHVRVRSLNRLPSGWVKGEDLPQSW